MRQAQHNKRGRGRGRKSSNPGNRVYESNGPDVKVRGNANHIAEKYIQLARDAASSGDTVAAENYLQHAEHYNRLVAAAQAQIQEQQQARGRQPQGSDDQERSDKPAAADGASQQSATNGKPVAASELDSEGGDEGVKPAGRPQRGPRRAKSAENQDTESVSGANGAKANGKADDVGKRESVENDDSPGDDARASQADAEA